MDVLRVDPFSSLGELQRRHLTEALADLPEELDRWPPHAALAVYIVVDQGQARRLVTVLNPTISVGCRVEIAGWTMALSNAGQGVADSPVEAVGSLRVLP